MKYQVVRLTVWLGFDWNNPFLTWDPAEYGGIESVHANHKHFWVSSVFLFLACQPRKQLEIHILSQWQNN
jgi:hypothetical protein